MAAVAENAQANSPREWPLYSETCHKGRTVATGANGSISDIRQPSKPHE